MPQWPSRSHLTPRTASALIRAAESLTSLRRSFMPAHEGDAFHGLNSLTIFIASALNCFRRFKMPGMFVNSEHTNERWRRHWTNASMGARQCRVCSVCHRWRSFPASTPPVRYDGANVTGCWRWPRPCWRLRCWRLRYTCFTSRSTSCFL